MPCCKLCNSIQTASIIGRIIVAFSAIGIVIGFLRMVITLITGAIFQAVMAGILIFGAQHRNRTALLFWMFITILELIVTTTFLALVLIVLIYPDFLRYLFIIRVLEYDYWSKLLKLIPPKQIMSQSSIWALDQPPEMYSLIRSSLEVVEDHECDYCETNFQNCQFLSYRLFISHQKIFQIILITDLKQKVPFIVKKRYDFEPFL